jgi:hypothetical protein
MHEVARDAAYPGIPDADWPMCVPPANIGFFGLSHSASPIGPKATVVSVEAARLGLRSASGGDFALTWFGPSLVPEFSMGEVVDVTSQPSFTLIRGRDTTLAIHDEFFNIGSVDDRALTLEGTDLKIRYANVCTARPTEKCNRIVYIDIYDLRASTDTATVDVRPAETKTIGDSASPTCATRQFERLRATRTRRLSASSTGRCICSLQSCSRPASKWMIELRAAVRARRQLFG